MVVENLSFTPRLKFLTQLLERFALLPFSKLFAASKLDRPKYWNEIGKHAYQDLSDKEKT